MYHTHSHTEIITSDYHRTNERVFKCLIPHPCVCMCGGQRAAFKNYFSFSTFPGVSLILRIKLAQLFKYLYPLSHQRSFEWSWSNIFFFFKSEEKRNSRNFSCKTNPICLRKTKCSCVFSSFLTSQLTKRTLSGRCVVGRGAPLHTKLPVFQQNTPI